ncbi:MAG: o-succinylbenzoate synthase [Bacteroidales bacterium]|nr:o-succinylbenzoate synthase [Bacteroidales bacterium]MCF8402601.1 o-succinylbenzoate synthase [Bacteroidales bacterium]
MLHAELKKYTLKFKFPAGTSRGVLTEKETWFIILRDETGKTGIGECGLLKGLSIDDRPDYKSKLGQVCKEIKGAQSINPTQWNDYPSIRFGLEMALSDHNSKKERVLFPSDFTNGKNSILINGLVWMGDFDFMQKQITYKIDNGFKCIKLKIGAIDFEKEIELIKLIRNEFSKKDIELRVDANGAFRFQDAIEKLKRLSDFDLHSIEQPIKQGQWEEMAKLCEVTPLPIALDEELIGIFDKKKKEEFLDQINPHYIILKPSLLGGFAASEEWINLAEKREIGWWVTSALESNIGLNAIAQWTYTLGNKMPQGLGTGQLYTNNFTSPLFIHEGRLNYGIDKYWNLNPIISESIN